MPTTISGSTGVTFPAGGVGNTAGAAVGTTDTQTLTNKTLGSGLVASASLITSGTVNGGAADPLASGTSVDFTNIPSWVKRITVMFSGVSTSGTSPIITQIGAGSIQTTSYSGSTWYANTTNSSNSTGIIVTPTNAAAKTWDAVITAILLNSATGLWVFSVVAGENPTASGVVGAGSKTLSGTLDRLRITTVGSPATDTFDAGSINILYE
jgi:hypothetical protein